MACSRVKFTFCCCRCCCCCSSSSPFTTLSSPLPPLYVFDDLLKVLVLLQSQTNTIYGSGWWIKNSVNHGLWHACFRATSEVTGILHILWGSPRQSYLVRMLVPVPRVYAHRCSTKVLLRWALKIIVPRAWELPSYGTQQKCTRVIRTNYCQHVLPCEHPDS